MNLNPKEKQTHRHRKQTYGYQRGKRWEGINSEFWVSRYKLHKTDKQKGPII